jgi:uncharacterized membrane protein
MSFLIRFFSIVIFCFCVSVLHAQKRQQHRLHISSNGRYFINEKGEPFFWGIQVGFYFQN